MKNKTILSLIERASRKGVAKAYSYNGYYNGKQRVEKYRVEHVRRDWSLFPNSDIWSLYHYGTLTATVTGGAGAVVYGESRSDVDSIQTFLTELTGDTPELHFYPSKDLFQVVCNGQVVNEF